MHYIITFVVLETLTLKRRYRQFLTSEIIQTRNQRPGGHGRGPGGCNCDAGDTNIVVKTVTRVTPAPPALSMLDESKTQWFYMRQQNSRQQTTAKCLHLRIMKVLGQLPILIVTLHFTVILSLSDVDLRRNLIRNRVKTNYNRENHGKHLRQGDSSLFLFQMRDQYFFFHRISSKISEKEVTRQCNFDPFVTLPPFIFVIWRNQQVQWPGAPQTRTQTILRPRACGAETWRGQAM